MPKDEPVEVLDALIGDMACALDVGGNDDSNLADCLARLKGLRALLGAPDVSLGPNIKEALRRNALNGNPIVLFGGEYIPAKPTLMQRLVDATVPPLAADPTPAERICRSCSRPYSPTHDINADGPTTRHPFIPVEILPLGSKPSSHCVEGRHRHPIPGNDGKHSGCSTTWCTCTCHPRETT